VTGNSPKPSSSLGSSLGTTVTIKPGAYSPSLQSHQSHAPISGINPFTGAEDNVSHFTDLLLWNNGTSSILFNSDDYLTTEIIYIAK
jgi:hypothetical protein